uniref:Uncharacterized protein n=1 Tax=Romanomermis culicivorax TaxID=13658 RepID=A0A915KVS0_ROMCU
MSLFSDDFLFPPAFFCLSFYKDFHTYNDKSLKHAELYKDHTGNYDYLKYEKKKQKIRWQGGRKRKKAQTKDENSMWRFLAGALTT